MNSSSKSQKFGVFPRFNRKKVLSDLNDAFDSLAVETGKEMNNGTAPSPSSTENKDVACFLVVKHSWKGKYKRIFSVGTHGVTTYNPATLENTNQWSYGDFFSIKPSNRPGSLPGEFTINMRTKSKKSDHMRFSSEYTAEILTMALRYRHLFAEPPKPKKRINGYKHHWSDNRVSVVLEVGDAGLNQVDARGKVVTQYEYRKIAEFIKLSDYPGGFIVSYGEQQRLHLFACQGCDELIQSANEAGIENVGIGCRIRKETVSFQWYMRNRLGRCGSDQQVTSFVEFTVHKSSIRHNNPVRRLLCLSETCILERDPATYIVVTVRPLLQVSSVIRSENNPQQFQLEFESGDVRTYTATDRDNILASIVDGVRSAGNNDVHVRMSHTDRGLRIVPLNVFLDEESESQLLRNVIAPPPGLDRFAAIQRFNMNIPYSGLLNSVTQEGFFTENKEKVIVSALQAVLGAAEVAETPLKWETLLQALRRLFASKAGFHAFLAVPGLREKLGKSVVDALKLNSEAVNHSAIDMLCALIQPMHSNYELKQEQMNKSSLLHSKKFLEHLLDVMANHVAHGTGALVIASMLDFLTYSLCAPYSETTLGDQFDALLDLVAAKGRVLYKLFQYPSMTIVKGTGLVMKAIIEESGKETSRRMQELALAEGALLKHIHLALFTESKDVRMLTNRQLSRKLIALWITGNEAALKLLSRAMPKGLLNFLDSKDDVPYEEDMLTVRNNLNMANAESDKQMGALTQQMLEIQRNVEKQMESLLEHWKLRQKITFLQKKEKAQEKAAKPIVLRKRRERVKEEANWKLFFYKFGKDHALPDLIWNHKTREELRECLDNEIRALNTDRELTMSIPLSWNHVEFEAHYPSLSNEVRIGDYFLRLLLEEDKVGTENPTQIHKSYEFFNEVYHHFLLSGKAEMRCLCLQALAVVYGRHHEEIGVFPDTRYIVAMLERCHDYAERDHLLTFISKLILNKENVREVINANGITMLVDLATLAHLHVSRAYVHTQTNVIEASADQIRDGAMEWYYSGSDSSRQGPISFQELKRLFADGTINERTKCWSQGLEGWKPLSSITQLRWTMAATGHCVMNETELAVLIINMLITMCEYSPSRDEDGCIIRPVPKVKRILSTGSCLPHIVQLLLTFDPVVVQKTATLLYLLMQDNPFISRLYLTGVFFFILMYTGSNVLPIASFLHYTHMKQAFRSETAKSDVISSSVLSPLLPEAATFYLENYGPEKYAEVFLGEFDHPEIIWNSEMRRQMVEKLAAHVADFSHRLPSNIKAMYQYCPIPSIVYPQLEEELFCCIYYLRHLCDTTRFPDWPIKDPIAFLKACLGAWHEEIEKKPPTLSIEEACQILNIQITDQQYDESSIRKAYFKLAQKYHPDKNPEGREMFEKINFAYEFLCSRASKISSGPDPERIVLCIKAQSIVYSRHTEELAPYKYAGYTQLIKTIRLETEDEMLFSKGAPLLSAAAELAYYTLACSPINAEQLRREDGLEALLEAFDRCVSVLSLSSKPGDLAVQVCLHICRCFSTAAQFEGCRERLGEMANTFHDLCRVLFFKHLVKVSGVAAECVRSFAIDSVLQTHLFQTGVLWYLIPNLFQYDFTLDEGGVRKEEGSNQQELQNRLARASCEALAALAGYREGCPENDGVQNSIRALLTPYVVRLMLDSPTDYVLKLLNSNTENPYLIWDNGTRAEMLDFVETERSSSVKNSELMGAEFAFSAYEKELIIGEIFVRVYNEQPNFIFEHPKKFCVDLLDYLNSQAQYLHSLLSMGVQHNGAGPTGDAMNMRLRHVQMAIEALRNILKGNPGLEIQCIGHFKLLSTYLRLDHKPELQIRALEVISVAAANLECVSDMAASGVVMYLFLFLHSLPKSAPLVLSTLLTLSSHGKVVKDALEMGGLIYILDLFCNHDDADVRIGAAELLGKLQSDKLTGPRWSRLILKFLPPIFSEAVRDSASSCIQLFDSTTENPELIWNPETRQKIQHLVLSESKKLYNAQKDNPDYYWKAPDDMTCAYEDVISGELVIGGVFLRLFISNPSWVVRQPRQFFTELIERTLQEMRTSKPNGDLLETLSMALVALLQNQPSITEQIATQGYVPQVCEVMSLPNKNVAKAAIHIFQQMTKDEVCVNSLSSASCLPGIMAAMKLRQDQLHAASQGLRTMFEKDNSQLIEQALREKLIEFLLGLLGAPLPELDNPSAVKAEIVKTLKAMTVNLEYGEKILEILNNSKIWAEFKDQKHDLFLASTPTAGYLTGGSAVAGYLTQGLSNNPPSMPPPHP